MSITLSVDATADPSNSRASWAAFASIFISWTLKSFLDGSAQNEFDSSFYDTCSLISKFERGGEEMAYAPDREFS